MKTISSINCNRLKEVILNQASGLIYTVADEAPSTERELWTPANLKVWSGASERTIFGDRSINWAFRAVHDKLHLATGIGFSPDEEIYLGRLQALQVARIAGDLAADLVYLEVAGQAEHYKQTGDFVEDQIEWTLAKLRER